MFDVLIKMYRLLIRPEFTVVIHHHTARITQGKLSDRILTEFTEIAGHCDLSTGTIYGIRTKKYIKLEFSGTIPKAHHQRFRNVFNANK